jgi:hypothetical protein
MTTRSEGWIRRAESIAIGVVLLIIAIAYAVSWFRGE